jgi:DNA-binding NarL/FixJ family response regulator
MKRVFVVEDHPLMRQMLCTLVSRRSDLEVCGTAASGGEALEKIPAAGPDLVLVDVSLPGMSGFDLISAIMDDSPDLLALIVSGHDESVYADQALRSGARGYVMKGNPLAIVKAIEAVLAGKLWFSDRVRESALA